MQSTTRSHHPLKTKAPWLVPRSTKAEQMDNQTATTSSALYPSTLAPGQIRLLMLKSGQGSDPLEGSLHTVSLNEKPEYEALSYVWGDAATTRPINLDGHPHPVTLNLESALRHLRLQGASRVLWVDAVCINQGNVTERNNQVKHMGSVYEQARRVLVWLGESSEHTEAAVDAIEFLSRDGALHRVWSNETEKASQAGFRGKPFMKALGSLFDRPWFNRIWTLQELILGADVMFACGDRMVTLNKLERTMISVFDRTGSWRATFEKEWPKEFNVCASITLLLHDRRDYEDRYVTTTEHNLRRWNLQAEETTGRYGTTKYPNDASPHEVGVGINLNLVHTPSDGPSKPYTVDLENLPSMSSRSHLLHNMWAHQYRQCLDPRDKVYGFLGLGRGTDADLVTPNYELSADEVFQDFAYTFIQRKQNLDILSLLSIERDLTGGRWVPNWEQKNEELDTFVIGKRFDALQMFSASGDTVPKIVRAHPRAIRANGVLCDTIAYLVHGYPSSFAWALCLQWLIALGLESDFRRPYVGGGDLKQAFWRLLTKDSPDFASFPGPLWFQDHLRQRTKLHELKHCEARGYHDREGEIKAIEKYLSSNVNRLINEGEAQDLDLTSHYRTLDQALILATFERQLVISTKGYIGLVHRTAQPGDKICLLFGGRVPYILHDLGVTDEETGFTAHVLLGDCRVQGLMHGEGMAAFEAGQVAEESFLIV